MPRKPPFSATAQVRASKLTKLGWKLRAIPSDLRQHGGRLGPQNVAKSMELPNQETKKQ